MPKEIIKTLAQLAGVECPKEKQSMKKPSSCYGCDNYSACMMALPPELRLASRPFVNIPLCPDCNVHMRGHGHKEYNRSTAEWRRLFLCPVCGAWWERRTDLEKENKSDD